LISVTFAFENLLIKNYEYYALMVDGR